MSESAAIEVRAASRHFDALRAVDGVDLTVRRGEIFGLIGHNGAGKSTLFRLMLGLLPPDAGSVRVVGCVAGGPGWREARRRIGYLPEQLALYDALSGRETLAFFARLKGAPQAQIEPLLERVGLAPAASRAVRTYSKGMRQRLGLAQALLGEPELLLLDEPSNGLDPAAIREFYALLAEQCARQRIGLAQEGAGVAAAAVERRRRRAQRHLQHLSLPPTHRPFVSGINIAQSSTAPLKRSTGVAGLSRKRCSFADRESHGSVHLLRTRPDCRRCCGKLVAGRRTFDFRH